MLPRFASTLTRLPRSNTIKSPFDLMFRDFFGPLTTQPFIAMEDWAPKADISEAENAWTVHADLPGVKKEDIKLEVHKGVLEISGVRSSEVKEGDEKSKAYRVERSFGSFKRFWTLPENANEDAIDARLENGVLDVTIPKKSPQAPIKKSIAIQ